MAELSNGETAYLAGLTIHARFGKPELTIWPARDLFGGTLRRWQCELADPTVRPPGLAGGSPLRPIALFAAAVNQRAPSGPAVMPSGPPLTPFGLPEGSVNSVIVPVGLIRPILSMLGPLLFITSSANQRLWSGPAVMLPARLPDGNG